MARILITGANGLTGQRLLAQLRGHEVTALVRALPAQPLEHVDYLVLDLASPWDARALPPLLDTIVHLAQPSDTAGFPADAARIYAINTGSVALLLDHARRAGAGTFVLASTGGLYGSQAGSLREDSPLSPPRGRLEYYFRTKQCAEILTEPYRACFAVVIVRPFFIYGPGQPGARLIPRLAHAVRNRLPIQIAGAQGTEMNPIYVDDAAAGFAAAALLTQSETLNLAGPQVVSVRGIAERIAAWLQLPVEFTQTGATADRYVAGTHRLEQLLGRPLLDFDAGLQSTLHDWAPRHG